MAKEATIQCHETTGRISLRRNRGSKARPAVARATWVMVIMAVIATTTRTSFFHRPQEQELSHGLLFAPLFLQGVNGFQISTQQRATTPLSTLHSSLAFVSSTTEERRIRDFHGPTSIASTRLTPITSTTGRGFPRLYMVKNSETTLQRTKQQVKDTNKRNFVVDDDEDDNASFLSRLANPFTSQSSIQSTSNISDENNNGALLSLPPGLSAIQAVVNPVMEKLDDSSEFILSYADLRPDSASTVPGQAFLASNVFYAVTGILVALQGDAVFGLLTELCAVASFLYHYTQLQAFGATKAPTVRLAVLVDYVLALLSISVASFYLFTSLSDASLETFVSVALSIAFLLLSWVYETGRPYMLFHSLWHIFGAYSGFLIGSIHNHVPPPSFF